MRQAVKQKWQESVQESPGCLNHPLYDHYEIFQQAVDRIRGNLKLLEMLQGMNVG